MARQTPMDMKMKIAVIVFSVVVFVKASPVTQPTVQKAPVLRSVIGNFLNCMNSDPYLCFKEYALKAVERVNAARKLHIIDGITIFNSNPRQSRSFEPLSTDLEERRKEVAKRLWESTSELIQNGELEITYGSDEDESRDLGDVEEGRGKKKKKKKLKKKLKMLMPLAAILKAKALIVIAFAVKIIAIALVKLAVIAKVTILTKLFGMLRELLAKMKGSDHHEDHHFIHETYDSPSFESPAIGPYARSEKVANDLAYSAYER